jgi:hypothetical protein
MNPVETAARLSRPGAARRLAKELPGRAQQPTEPFYIFRTDIPDDKISQSIL